MGKKQADKIDKEASVFLAGELWIICCKVRGIGELIRNQDGEPSLQQAEANLGVGEILIGLADELNKLRNGFSSETNHSVNCE